MKLFYFIPWIAFTALIQAKSLSPQGLRFNETHAAKVDGQLVFFRLGMTANSEVERPSYEVTQLIEYRVYSESEGLSG